MRGMMAYIPLYANLTSTQGCIRGLVLACVCVCVCGEEQGGGGCQKENVHQMKGSMTVGER